MGLKKKDTALGDPPSNIGENLNKSVIGKVIVPDIYDSLFADSGSKTSAGDADLVLTGGEQQLYYYDVMGESMFASEIVYLNGTVSKMVSRAQTGYRIRIDGSEAPMVGILLTTDVPYESLMPGNGIVQWVKY